MSDLYKTENQKVNEKIKKETSLSEKIIFNPIVYKRHLWYFSVFLSLSILSILDIVTRQTVAARYDLSDTGLISFFIGAIFGIISPAISGIVMVVLKLIFGFAILWIPIAIIEYFHIEVIAT